MAHAGLRWLLQRLGQRAELLPRRAGARHRRPRPRHRADAGRPRRAGTCWPWRAFLYAMEFVADKIPYIDSTWDAVSTAIRPTAGAVVGVLLAGSGRLPQRRRRGRGRWRHRAALPLGEGRGPAGDQLLPRAGQQHRREHHRGRRGARRRVVRDRASASRRRDRGASCCSAAWCCSTRWRKLVRRGWRRWKGTRPGRPTAGLTLGCAHGPGGGDRRRLRRPRLGAAAGQARPRRHAGRASASSAARWSRSPPTASRGTPSRHTLLPGGGPRPVPQDRPAAGEGARAGASSTACASTGSRTAPRSSSRPGRAAQLEAVRGARARARASAGSTTSSAYADDWEVLRRRLPRGARGTPTHLRRELAARLDSRESLRQRLRRLPDERLRLVAAHPFAADGHDLARRARLGRAHGVPRAALRRLGVRRRDGRAARGAGPPARHPRGRGRPRPRATDVVVRERPRGRGRHDRAATSTPTSSSAPSTRAGCPRCAASVRATMPAIPPALVPRRARAARCATCPTSWSSTATRLLVVRTRRPGARRPARLDGAGARAGSTRTSLAALARHGLDVREQVVTRVDRSPRDLVERWGGIAARRAVAGARHRPPAARAADADRRACTPPARTRRPGPGCRTSGCPPRWSPRWSGPPASASWKVDRHRRGRPRSRRARARRRAASAFAHAATDRPTPPRPRRPPAASPSSAPASPARWVAALDGVGVRRLAGRRLGAPTGRPPPARRPRSASRSPTASASAASSPPAASMSAQRIVSEWRASKPAGRPGRRGRPDLERRRADPLRRRVLAAGRDDLLGRAVGAGERLGDAGRAVDRRDADDGGVGDDPGLALAGDGDGAHAASCRTGSRAGRRQAGDLQRLEDLAASPATGSACRSAAPARPPASSSSHSSVAIGDALARARGRVVLERAGSGRGSPGHLARRTARAIRRIDAEVQ